MGLVPCQESGCTPVSTQQDPALHNRLSLACVGQRGGLGLPLSTPGTIPHVAALQASPDGSPRKVSPPEARPGYIRPPTQPPLTAVRLRTSCSSPAAALDVRRVLVQLAPRWACSDSIRAWYHRLRGPAETASRAVGAHRDCQRSSTRLQAAVRRSACGSLLVWADACLTQATQRAWVLAGRKGHACTKR